MRVLNFVLAAALCGGVLLFAGSASAQRLDGIWYLADDSDPENNFAEILMDGTEFYVSGGVEGVGTAGDVVFISYVTDSPRSVNVDDKQGRVRQSRFSYLRFQIASDTPARDLFLEVSPEKCSIDGKVQADKARGAVTLQCSADDLYAGFTADQLASLQAAFLDNNKVKIKAKSDGSKGSLAIKLEGDALGIK